MKGKKQKNKVKFNIRLAVAQKQIKGKNKDAQKKVGKKGMWRMYPNNHTTYGSKLNIADFQIVDELSYLMRPISVM